jgi:CRP-like cAMP-binding protein
VPGLLDLVQPATAALLVAAADRRVYPKRSYVFHDGEPVTVVLIIETGMVKVSKTSLGGRSVVLAIDGPGAVIGELAVIDSDHRAATVETLEETTVLAIAAADFARLMAETADLAAALNVVMASRLRGLTDQVLRLGTSDGRARLASKLVELVPPGAAFPREIRLPLSQKELAEWVGLSREAVVRALTELRNDGLVRTGRLTLEILDIDGLRRAAG